MTHTEEVAQRTEETPDRKEIWRRGAYMLFFVVAFGIGQALINLTALVQFLTLLIGGKPNEFLAAFGRSLGRWFADVTAFQSGASEEKPFPWAPWPEAR